MKLKLILTGLAVAALFAAPVAVQAADLSTPSYKAPAYVAPSYATWSGFYVGLNAGYGFGNSSVTNDVGTTGNYSVTGFVAGLTLGYNFQTGVWVWGIEGDGDYSAIKGTSTAFCVPACTTTNTWLGTVRGRLGYGGFGSFMPYITGGGAIGGVKFSQAATTDTQTNFGWTAGVGLEYALFSSWSVKAEYLYVDLGTATCKMPTCNAGADVKTTFNTSLVRAGVNYRF